MFTTLYQASGIRPQGASLGFVPPIRIFLANEKNIFLNFKNIGTLEQTIEIIE